MKYGLLIFGLAALLLLGRVLSAPTPDVSFLASDAHFSIGGQHIVVPVVALGRPQHTFDLAGRRPNDIKEVLRPAGDPNRPMKAERIDLSIRQYQYAGEHVASIGICPLLKRNWSATLCRGQHQGLLTHLPKTFALLDSASLEPLKSNWTIGRERVYDQVEGLALRPGETKIVCDKRSRFCTAIVEALPGLLATWTVWGEDQGAGTAEQMAQTQAAAVVQFVRRAIGPIEDPTLLSAE